MSVEAFRESNAVRPHLQTVQSFLQKSGDVIEADAAKANSCFLLAAGIRDDDDGMRAVKDRAGPRGVLTGETNIDAARQMRGGKLGGVARIKDLGACSL